MKMDNADRLADPEKLYIGPTRFHGNSEKKLSRKEKLSPGGGHFDYRWEDENLIK